MKQYSATEQGFIYEWADRWFQLVQLIFDLIRTDEPTWSPPPTELDEIKYQSLRSWFIDHHLQFTQLWRDFYESQDWNLDPRDDLIAQIRDAQRCLENPFFICYGPKNLCTLVQVFILDIESRKPSEHKAWTSAITLLSMDKMVVEFFDWIYERAYASE